MEAQISAPREMRTSGWRVQARRHWVAIALIISALIVPTSQTLLHSLKTSPVDEWVYIDYTDRVFTDGRAKAGGVASEYTTKIMACHGVMQWEEGKRTFGDCSAPEVSALPFKGHPTAASYTPLYFWVTATLGAVIQFATGVEPLVAWRLTGAFWLAAAMLFIYLLFKRWRVPDLTILVTGMMIISAPYTWHAHTFVTTDAPNLLVGAAVLYLATRIRRGQISVGWLLLVIPVAVALKGTNLVAVGLALVYLMLSWVGDVVLARSGPSARPQWRQLGIGVAVASATLAITVLGQMAWLRFVEMTAVGPYRADQGIDIAMSKSELTLAALRFLPSAMAYNYFLGDPPYSQLKTPIKWLCVAGVLGLFFLVKRWGRVAELAYAIALSSILMAPALAIALQITTGTYFTMPSRYGASLIPAFMLATALILRNKVAHWLIAALAVGYVGVGTALSVLLQ